MCRKPANDCLIDGQLFSSFGKVFDRWSLLPPHARIGIDVHGIDPKAGDWIHWRLLEASLFEDLAMLWNEAVRLQQEDRPVHNEERIL